MSVGLLISIARNKNKQKIKHTILFFSQKKKKKKKPKSLFLKKDLKKKERKENASENKDFL